MDTTYSFNDILGRLQGQASADVSALFATQKKQEFSEAEKKAVEETAPDGSNNPTQYMRWSGRVRPDGIVEGFVGMPDHHDGGYMEIPGTVRRLGSLREKLVPVLTKDMLEVLGEMFPVGNMQESEYWIPLAYEADAKAFRLKLITELSK